MNIIFMGTPEFAVAPLKALIEDTSGQFRVKLVVTRPDAASSRGKTLLPSPVRVVAEENGISVLTPKSFYTSSSALPDNQATSSVIPAKAEIHNEPDKVSKRVVDIELLDKLSAVKPDFIIVAAFGLILPLEVLSIPKYGCINIHGSLLPRWRGAAPIQRAILAGDEQVGVCIMQMEAGLDTGPYCAEASTISKNKNAEELVQEISRLGAELLIQSLPRIAGGAAEWTKQNDAEATYADKIEKSELALSPQDTAIQNVRRVLASSAQAPARCEIAGRSLTVIKADIATKEDSLCAEASLKDIAASGQSAISLGAVFLINKHLILQTAGGIVEIKEVKPDGKSAMDARSFAAGIKELQKGGEGTAFWRAIEPAGKE